VADIIGARPGFSVLLLSVGKAPEGGRPQDRPTCQETEAEHLALLRRARQMLLDRGVAPGSAETRFVCPADGNIAKAILDIQKAEGFGTVVVGRRGVSKTEEFLFGSVSTRVVHHAHNCTVWVVE
jgi:nucleotide-binding universal stress UspA family protein